MFLIYVLWLMGIIFTVFFLTEIGIMIYKLMKKNEAVKGNLIAAIICIIISITCISSVLFMGVEKIIKYNADYLQMEKGNVESPAE